MDAAEQIKKFHELIETNYYSKLLEAMRQENAFLVIDFMDLVKFDTDLANELLEFPEETIKAAELSINQFDLEENSKRLRIRLNNLPDSQKVMIRDIRSKHLNKLIVIDGLVKQKSDVRPLVTAARFECPSCGNIINILQLDTSFKEPSRCGCGRKGKFTLLSKELVDAQGMSIEESPERLEGGDQPKRINVFLKDDLVSPLSDRKTGPGSKVLISGILKEVPIILKTGSKSTKFDLIIEANMIEAVEESFTEVNITPEEEEAIREIGSDSKVFDRLITSVAPSIFGHERIKEALLIQMMGGVRKTRRDKVTSRGDIHVLLLGDPGAAKSQMLKRMSLVAPKARYVSGRGASGAGLTATVVKDEFLKGWSLEAGALVLASDGICMIDEMDKMSAEDTATMHEALEQQTISISKANIQATLISRTTVLAAANPKFGRFDPYGIIAEQINMPPTLINRFDLIFPIRDIPDEVMDKKLAEHILGLHKDPDAAKTDISTELLKKYIAYAKQKISPELTNEALEEIKTFYLKMRASGGSEENVKSIPISARQLEGLVRLSEAAARMRLSPKVTKRDAKRAVELLEYCLMQIGLDKETGKIDIDRITTGISASARSHISNVREIIANLESKIGKTIPIDDVIAEAAAKGISEEHVEEAIQKLKRSGDLFEPKRGFLSRI